MMKFKYTFLFLFLFSASVFAQCLVPIDSTYDSGLPATSCVSNYLHDEPGWCEYQVIIPEGREEVFINYVSADIEFTRHFSDSNSNLVIWVDQTTLPAYLSCAYYDPVKDDVFCMDKIEFGKAEEWLPENVNYFNIDKDNIYSKWLFGMLFILVGAFILFDAFFNNRFSKFV